MEPLAPLYAELPTIAELAALPGLSRTELSGLPVAEGRLAAPFAVTWKDDEISSLRFEVYAETSPLAPLSARLYRALVDHPASRQLRTLALGEVACTSELAVEVLGDPRWLLAREGLPASVVDLSLARLASVTHAGDLGYVPIGDLSPLHGALAGIERLHLESCERLGRLALPRLRALRITSTVTAANIQELAQAELPALEELELACDLFAEPELRIDAVRALLAGNALPGLRRLVLRELDLDDDQHAELADDDPPSWIEMLAEAPAVRRLDQLTLAFRGAEREAEMLEEHADAFEHLTFEIE